MTYHTISDQAMQPLPALTVTGSLSAANWLGMTLPDVIQLFGAGYAILLFIHKLYQMYKEWKQDREDESKK